MTENNERERSAGEAKTILRTREREPHILVTFLPKKVEVMRVFHSEGGHVQHSTSCVESDLITTMNDLDVNTVL